MVLDTSVAIDILGGDERAAALVQGGLVYISAITRVELLCVSRPGTHPKQAALELISDCRLVEFTTEIQDLAVHIRTKYRLKLPDASIAATAAWLQAELITADKKFGRISEEVSVKVYQR